MGTDAKADGQTGTNKGRQHLIHTDTHTGRITLGHIYIMKIQTGIHTYILTDSKSNIQTGIHAQMETGIPAKYTETHTYIRTYSHTQIQTAIQTWTNGKHKGHTDRAYAHTYIQKTIHTHIHTCTQTYMQHIQTLTHGHTNMITIHTYTLTIHKYRQATIQTQIQAGSQYHGKYTQPPIHTACQAGTHTNKHTHIMTS